MGQWEVKSVPSLLQATQSCSSKSSANEDNDTVDPPVEEMELWSWPQIPTANGTSGIVRTAVAQTFQTERK